MRLQNILFLGPFPPTLGGAYYTNFELVSGIISQGLNAEVLARPCEGDEEFDRTLSGNKSIRVRRLPYTVTRPPSPPPDGEVRKLTAYMRDFLRAKREGGETPDLFVTGHDQFAWYNPVIKEFGVPLVQQLMGTPTNLITQGIYPAQKTQQFLRSVAIADHIICVAHHLKDVVLKVVPGCSEQHVSVVHNEIDTSLFAPGPPARHLRRQLDLPTKARVIVHVSNFKAIKRVQDIVASAEKVLSKRDDVYYLLVGAEGHFEEIVAMVRASAHADRFRLPGKVSHHEVPNYLNQGMVFVLSSEAEGLPRAAMEAQACGLYLITSDCPAGRELTAGGTIGCTYPIGDVQALAKTTLQVLEMDPELFEKIRTAGKDKIVKHFSKGTQIEKYMAALNQVYGSHNNG